MPVDTAPLLSAFKPTNSEVSASSVNDRRVRPLAQDSEPLTLSLEEWIEVTIFVSKIIVVQGLSFHHFENLVHRLRQHLEQ